MAGYARRFAAKSLRTLPPCKSACRTPLPGGGSLPAGSCASTALAFGNPVSLIVLRAHGRAPLTRAARPHQAPRGHVRFAQGMASVLAERSQSERDNQRAYDQEDQHSATTRRSEHTACRGTELVQVHERAELGQQTPWHLNFTPCIAQDTGSRVPRGCPHPSPDDSTQETSLRRGAASASAHRRRALSALSPPAGGRRPRATRASSRSRTRNQAARRLRRRRSRELAI